MPDMKALLKTRGEIETKAKALFDANPTFTADQQKEFDGYMAEIDGVDAQIANAKAMQQRAAQTAQPVAGQDTPAGTVDNGRGALAPAEAKKLEAYEKDPTLVIGACVKALAATGNVYTARPEAEKMYGERHPVTRALVAGNGPQGAFIVPPDVMPGFIELLRARAVVRASNPRNIPMPRGTMTIPRQSGAGTASYGSETSAITASRQSLDQIVASYKKLTAMVGISNDLMRYADPAIDALVRDDLVRIIGLREDLAFLLGDGTANSPMGFLGFANRWVNTNAGTIGSWSKSAASTYAINGADPANTTGGNFITSTASYTLATVVAELAGAVNRLDQANVPDSRRRWFFSPRTYNYLYNVQNSLGLYVFRDELNKGTLLGYPFSKTTQIGTTYWDNAGSNNNKDCSFILLVEMDEAMLLDSMTLTLTVSQDGTYVDESGNTVNAFQNDQTLIRAIEEHDFQMRHDQSVAVIQGVRWAPALG